ncbi:hypothetical protein ACSBOB_14740 [Mesorhizobium sp. ASY16-5R]|uniref:hypothetical protein n=1 Tax=Mesorhizobium sp. ASY16-5R TaxID=3445772 RepID=UPI003F9FF3D7
MNALAGLPALATHNRRAARVKLRLDAFHALFDRAMLITSTPADVDAALRAGRRAFNVWRQADRLHPCPDPDSAAIIDRAAREAAELLGRRRVEIAAADRGVTVNQVIDAIERRLEIRRIN